MLFFVPILEKRNISLGWPFVNHTKFQKKIRPLWNRYLNVRVFSGDAHTTILANISVAGIFREKQTSGEFFIKLLDSETWIGGWNIIKVRPDPSWLIEIYQ